jgi:hypothetical protein
MKPTTSASWRGLFLCFFYMEICIVKALGGGGLLKKTLVISTSTAIAGFTSLSSRNPLSRAARHMTNVSQAMKVKKSIPCNTRKVVPAVLHPPAFLRPSTFQHNHTLAITGVNACLI